MLSSEFRDRLLVEFIECLDDEGEPEIALESVSVSAFRKALKKREPERIIPLEAVFWLMRSHCSPIENGLLLFPHFLNTF